MGWFDRGRLPAAERRSLVAARGSSVHVLAWARAEAGVVAGLTEVLAIGADGAWRFVGWHTIETGGWDAAAGVLRWRTVEGADDQVVLSHPGSLPDLFRERVAASIVIQRRVELGRRRTAVIAARRNLGERGAGLDWRISVVEGSLDDAAAERLSGELARLRADYDFD